MSENKVLEGYVESYPIENLKGADYNPRIITDDDFENLKRSVKALGVVKPIIISNDLIIAGHQRTKALRAVGATHAPVFIIPKEVNKTDECRFNQLHNGADIDKGDENAKVPPSDTEGYKMIPIEQLSCKLRGGLSPVRTCICQLMSVYGNWGACVALPNGEIIHAAQYACACKKMSVPCRVYYLSEEKIPAAMEFLNKEYGRFYYQHLEKTTYGQSFAQMMRLREGERGKPNASPNWDWLMRHLQDNPDLRVLDFGAGQCDYAKKARKMGFKVFPIEFFHRTGDLIDTGKVHRMINRALAEVRKNGLFDFVISDYVMNSVDSVKAQEDVLTCLGAFCKQGGKVMFSGRRLERVLDQVNYTKTAPRHRLLEFLDSNNMTALYRRGHWHYQKYESQESATALAKRFFGDEGEYYISPISTATWRITVVNNSDVVVTDQRREQSIRDEFDLMWPGGKSVGKADEAVSAWKEAKIITAARA